MTFRGPGLWRERWDQPFVAIPLDSADFQLCVFVVVVFQATDNDERGTNNSEVSYSLQQSNWSSHFAVDSDRGVLRVVSPVDYEAVTAGEITLTVIASDKGQPPLSGYVNVTVTLQVSVFQTAKLTFKWSKNLSWLSFVKIIIMIMNT